MKIYSLTNLYVFDLNHVVLLLLAKDYTSLFLANVFIGLGHGSVEAACNPLVATLFPNNKTKMLTKLPDFGDKTITLDKDTLDNIKNSKTLSGLFSQGLIKNHYLLVR